MTIDASVLLTPFKLGSITLRNRMVMAPLTRNRAIHGTDVPQLLNAEYYAQRAGDAGLIISEATQISPTGKGYAWTPGIYSEEQVAGWKLVTDAVHAKGGKIFLQLWHVGRISHPTLQPGGIAPVAPSAIAPVSPANDALDSSPTAVYFPLVRELNKLNLIYVHVIEGATGGPREFNNFDFHALRKEFKGAWMVNNGYNLELATEAISSGYADLVAFGKLYLANPDLAERFKTNASLNEPDQATFYGGGAKGYTDYSSL